MTHPKAKSILANPHLPVIVAGLIGVVFLCLYLSTMPLTHTGYTDSDLLLTLARGGGLAPPPGYPLYLFILRLFTSISWPFLSFAARGHLLSSFLAAISLSFMFITVYLLYPRFKKPTSKKTFFLYTAEIERLCLSAVTVSLLGLSSFFWLYAVLAETVAFNLLLTALICLSLTKLTLSQSPNWWLVLVISLVISLFHAPWLILILPAVIWYFWPLKNKLSNLPIKKIALCAGLTFGLVLVLILVQNFSTSTVSWHFQPSLSGLIDYFKTSEPWPTLYQQGLRSHWFGVVKDINGVLASLRSFIPVILQTYGWWLIVIIPLGVIRGYKTNKRLYLLYLLSFMLTGLVPILYFPFNTEWTAQAYLIRLFVPGYLLLAILTFPGWLDLISRTGNALVLLVRRSVVNASLILGFGLLLITSLWLRYPAHQLRSYTLTSLRYHEILTSLEPNALLTCYSDVACSALMYEQVVLHTRPDVLLAPLNYRLVNHSTLTDTDLNYFAYDTQPYLMSNLITWNLSKRPVYAVDLNDQYYQLLGLNFPFMYYLPFGSYGQLLRQLPNALPPTPSATISQAALDTPVYFWDPTRLQHKTAAARDHLLNGNTYLKMNLRDLSRQAFNQAGNIFFQLSPQDRAQFTGLRSSLEYAQPDSRFSLGSKVPTVEQLLNDIPTLIQAKRNKQAYINALGAVSIDPTNVLAHLALATIYDLMGDNTFAQREYQNVLRLDPNNASASAKLIPASL